MCIRDSSTDVRLDRGFWIRASCLERVVENFFKYMNSFIHFRSWEISIRPIEIPSQNIHPIEIKQVRRAPENYWTFPVMLTVNSICAYWNNSEESKLKILTEAHFVKKRRKNQPNWRNESWDVLISLDRCKFVKWTSKQESDIKYAPFYKLH